MNFRGEELFVVDYLGDNSKKIIYVPLRGYLGLVKKEFTNYIYDDNSMISNDFYNHLMSYEYIDPIKLHESTIGILPQLSIPITDNCNLMCKYCYFSAGEGEKVNTQSIESIKAYVDSYFSKLTTFPIRNKDNRLDVSISGGGEPTVAFDVFKYAVNYIEEKCEEQSLKPLFNMPTNGAFDDEVREFILNHFEQISFSMDGPKFIHDTHRPYKNGESSYDTVFESAKYFYENNLNFAFRVTVSDMSVNYLKEILDFFDANFPGKSVAFEPLNLFGRALECTELAPPDNDLYSEKLIEAYEHAKTRGISIKTAATGKFDQLRTVFCGAVGIPNWTITTDNRITSCTRDNLPEVFTFGEFNNNKNEIEIDDERIKLIREFNIFNYEDCADCFCKYNCAGDCPDLRISDMLNCDATKKVATFVLNEKIDGFN